MPNLIRVNNRVVEEQKALDRQQEDEEIIEVDQSLDEKPSVCNEF